MIRSVILFSFIINLFSVFLRMFLDAPALSTSLLLAKTNPQLRPRNASYSVIPDSNEVINAIPRIHIDTLYLLMSHFFEHSSIFPITHPPSSDILSLPLLYVVPDNSSVPPPTLPRLKESMFWIYWRKLV